MPASTDVSPPAFGLMDWARNNPVQVLLLATIAATVGYFYLFLPVYAGLPIGQWAWLRYRPEYNQEHSKLIPFIALFLVWYHRDALAKARKQGSNWGLLPIAIGLILYVVAARALQARLAIAALPFLFSGVLWFVWGKEVARILLFTSAMLLFLIPLGAIEQMSFRLQFIITGHRRGAERRCSGSRFTRSGQRCARSMEAGVSIFPKVAAASVLSSPWS